MGETEIEATTSRGAALERLAARLGAAGVEEPRREAALLLRRAAGVSAAALIAAPEARLGEAAARVEAFAGRREAGEPLSRIEGRREFFGRDFAVTPDVLDPRADTETLIEAALEALRARRGEALRVLDFGVGSGAILGRAAWRMAAGDGRRSGHQPRRRGDRAREYRGARACGQGERQGRALGRGARRALRRDRLQPALHPNPRHRGAGARGARA